jgi:cytochrome c oxidase subunit II
VRTPIFRGVRRWGVLLSALLLASLLLTACGENSPSILDTKGPVAAKEEGLFWFILVVATIVFVAVEFLLIYSIARFREKPNSPLPRQTHGNNTIEIIWTVVPSIFLFAVLVGTIYTMFSLSQPAGQKIDITVVGHQWWWEFDYNDNPNVVTADELVVPTGKVISLELHSDNVIHSFWVPQLTGKTDVVPGHKNTKWFQADQPGTYKGLCTEFCGLQHANMEFYVKAVSPNDYQTWLSSQQLAAQNSTDANVQAGKTIFTGGGGCQGCHGIVGVNLKSFNDPVGQNLIGPNLTHFGTRRTIAGGVLQWDPASCVVTGTGNDAHVVNKDSCNLYKWLRDPESVKEGNDMKIRHLSDNEIALLIAYLESLT